MFESFLCKLQLEVCCSCFQCSNFKILKSFSITGMAVTSYYCHVSSLDPLQGPLHLLGQYCVPHWTQAISVMLRICWMYPSSRSSAPNFYKFIGIHILLLDIFSIKNMKFLECIVKLVVFLGQKTVQMLNVQEAIDHTVCYTDLQMQTLGCCYQADGTLAFAYTSTYKEKIGFRKTY